MASLGHASGADDDRGTVVSMSQRSASRAGGPASLVGGGGSPPRGGVPATMDEIEPFLRYKDDQYARLLAKTKKLEAENDQMIAQCHTLNAKMESLAYITDSRPSLLQIIFDLHKMSEKLVKHIDDLALRIAVRDLGKRVVTQELEAIETEAKDVASGHQWIIANLFTEVEVLHLGGSMSHFESEAIAGTAASPTTPRRSMTPGRTVQVRRTTTMTTTTVTMSGGRRTPLRR